jgi:hypothetical protein
MPERDYSRGLHHGAFCFLVFPPAELRLAGAKKARPRAERSQTSWRDFTPSCLPSITISEGCICSLEFCEAILRPESSMRRFRPLGIHPIGQKSTRGKLLGLGVQTNPCCQSAGGLAFCLETEFDVMNRLG